jgi:hypothetical protein
MSKYQHIQVPNSTKEAGSSSLDALELLKMSKQRLSVADIKDLKTSQKVDPKEEEEENEKLFHRSSGSEDEKSDRETDAEVSEITSKDESHNSIPDSKLTSSSSHSSESNPSKSQSQKEELWALLNYSKVRLATGTTPTTSEAIALGMKTDEASQMTQKEQNKVTIRENDGTDRALNHDQTDAGSLASSEAKQFVDENDKGVEDDDDYDEEDDDEEEDDYDDGLPKFTKEQIEEARARAMAALSRSDNTKSTPVSPTMNSSNVTNRVQQTESSSNTKNDHQSDSFLIKSMALAEEAANAGETEFKTFNKMSILASMKTPRKGDNRSISNEERFNRLGMNMRHFISNTRQKLKEAKESITKMDKRNVGESVKSTVSPLKTFKENCLKVEKMNEVKYGESWEKSI